MTRRKFLKCSAFTALGTAAGFGYGRLEAQWLGVTRVTLTVPNLPAPFKGKTVAFLADFHHGPFVPLSYIRKSVDMTMALRPDLIILGGDYPHDGVQFIDPCVQEVSKLSAPLGVYSVLGNHDHYRGGQPIVSAALRAARIPELTNRGLWIEADGARFWLCGVDDYWMGKQRLSAALGPATASDAVILLSHNPDYVEKIHDPRVGLVLSGHTHGGQVVLPFMGAPIVPSLYGQKYAQGLVQGPVTKVFVTRGIGTVTPNIRLNCPPEIVLATLA
ncbi:MAG: metallophosphoesterase [Chthoniobacteraceae bacterium]|jgi:predicted MPP superfamily phosphohydrolase